MTLICDICGRNLQQNEVKLQTGATVWKATSNNYVPANLPSSWKVPGGNLASHWQNIVETNKAEDWGLCQICCDELDKFNSQHSTSSKVKTNSLEIKEKLIKLFHKTKNTDTLSTLKNADAFWLDARRLGSYSQVLAAMTEIQEERKELEEFPTIVASILAMKNLDETSWGTEYLKYSNLQLGKESFVETIRPTIQHFTNTNDPNPFYQVAMDIYTPNEAIEILFEFALEHRHTSSYSKTLGGNLSNLMADIQVTYLSDTWTKKNQDENSEISSLKTYRVAQILFEEKIKLEKERRKQEYEIKNKDKIELAKKLQEEAAEKSRQKWERKEHLQKRLVALETEEPAALKKLKEMQTSSLLRKRATDEEIKQQREFYIKLLQETSDAKEELKTL